MADETRNMTMGITIDDGYQRVPINNAQGEEIGVFYFNPTDIGIIERYNRLAERFDSITEPLEEAARASEDAGDEDAGQERQVEALAEARNRLYEAVNELFGGNAAEAFFGRVHPFSPVNGKFYCEAVLQAVGEYIGRQFDAETKKMNSRVKKYLNRAQRRADK